MREVVKLRLAGFDYEEVARQMGIGRESVKTMNRLARIKLSESMAPYKEIWETHISDFLS